MIQSDQSSPLPEIAALCDPYDKSPTECDGMTRILHTVLTKVEVPHTCFVGRIARWKGAIVIPLHMWIELEDGTIVDYRLRCYLGPKVPHGLFTAQDMKETGFQYRDARRDSLLSATISSSRS